MHILVKFAHGLGDAVQLTCVLRHLQRYRPDWTVDVATHIGKHSAYSGLCRRALVLGRDLIDESQYRHVFDLGWYECYSVYADSPCTKVCNCLREVFGISPDVTLLKYHVEVCQESQQKARDYLTGICKQPDHDDRFPVVAMHYQGNTSAHKKNLPHHFVAELCREFICRGYVPLILDWDRRSPLPDQKSIFCPKVGPGDLWENTGTGDAERLAALISQCALFVGVDSGPLHVAGATQTPTLGVWRGHSPVQFFDLCRNVTHLVPECWREIPPCQHAHAADFFAEHYSYRTYRDADSLPGTLIEAALGMLAAGRGVGFQPAGDPKIRAPPGRPNQIRNPRASNGRSEIQNHPSPELAMTTVTALSWQQMPGLAHEIALGADGSAWCLGMGELPSGGFSIHRWNGANWDHIDGAAVRIAVGPAGEAWTINRNHEVFRNSLVGQELLPGRAREIAVGANGAAWCISATDFAPGGGSIHVWNGRDWNHVEGAAVKIAVGPDGQPWIINSAGQIFRRSGEGWELLPGLAREIAIGAEGSVFCLCASHDPAIDSSIHLWNGFDWEHVPGAAVKIAAGLPGTVMLVNSQNQIFRNA